MKKKLRKVIVPNRKGKFSDKQIKTAVNGARRKKDYRDYYKEIGQPCNNVTWRKIECSKKTLRILKLLAKKWNASINYVIVRLLTEAIDDLRIRKESGEGDLLLTIVSGDEKKSPNKLEEF